MNTIKKFIKSNKILYSIALLLYKCAIYIFCWSLSIVYGISDKLSKREKAFDNVKGLKNKYSGRRCFIVATGPSLRVEDLDCLKDEVTISMNSIVKWFDRTDYRPTLYITQDNDFYFGSVELIKKFDPQKVFIGISDMGNRIGGPKEAILMDELQLVPGASGYNLNVSYNIANWRYLGGEWKKKFSLDCARQIFDGGTVTYSAIQLAAYIGCKDIYLLGVDNGSKKGQRSHATDDEEVGKKIASSINDDRFVRYQNEYIFAYKFLKRYGINLYNATRGGSLEGVPRVDFDSIIKID